MKIRKEDNLKEYNKIRTNKQGITLISMVVTIIIIIILAGVSINMVIGENGLITKAKYAKEQYAKDSAKEKLEMELIELSMHKNIGNNESIINMLENKGFRVNGNIITVDNYQFYIDKTSLEITENVDIIDNIEQFADFRDNVNNGDTYEGKTIVLSNDIDLSLVCGENIGSWIPIGKDYNKPFKGTFDGNNYTISNLYITNNNNNSFFGVVTGGTIKNVSLNNVYSSYSSSTDNNINVAGIVGVVNNGNIKNCGINSGSIIGINTNIEETDGNEIRVGGIVGIVSGNIKIENCYNNATLYVSSNSEIQNYRTYIGGIVSYALINENTKVEISNCYNTGKLSGKSYMNAMGGVVALVNNPSGNEKLGILKNSYNIGEITDESSEFIWLGGIVGRNGYGSNRLPIIIQNCYCSSETQVGYNYWDGTNTDVPNTEGVVDRNELKDYESILGIDNWMKDTKLLNNGFPILKWQNKDS